jgi:glycosyltransferase involved in cell wall biosynthesis
MTERPTISVIIPVYNGERFLAEAIQSVLDQTLPPDEIIVVDDGSTDGSAAIVAHLAESTPLPIRYVYQANQGPSAARNRGIEFAAGELLAFIDADDLWLLYKLADQYKYLIDHADIAVVWGLVQVCAMQDGAWVDTGEPWHGPNLGSALFRREAFQQVGTLDVHLRVSEDLDWVLRSREANLPQTVINNVVLRYRLHDGNMWLGRPKNSESLLYALKKRLNRRRDQPHV